MSKIVIVDNENITVEYLPDKKIIHHTIHQPFGGEPFRDALNAGTDFLKEHGVTKWLSDDRKNGPLAPEDAEWGANVWSPRTIEAGWKYWAMVVPTDVISAGSLVPSINRLYEEGLRIMVFDNVEAALEWLEGL
jgi:hypothetical protein